MRSPRIRFPLRIEEGEQRVEIGRYLSFRRPGGVRTLSWPCYWLDARTAFMMAIESHHPLADKVWLCDLYYAPGQHRIVGMMPWEVFLKELDVKFKLVDGKLTEYDDHDNEAGIPFLLPRRVTVRFHGCHWIGELVWGRGYSHVSHRHSTMGVAYRVGITKREPVATEVRHLITRTGTDQAKNYKTVNKVLSHVGLDPRPPRPPVRA